MARGWRICFLGSILFVCCRSNTDAAIAETKRDESQAQTRQGDMQPASDHSAASGPTTGSEGWLRFEVGGESIHIIKVADPRNHPMKGYLGEAEFRKALKDRRDPDLVLLHVVLPSKIVGARLAHLTGDDSSDLAEPNLIYRMSSSPRRTYCIVRAKSPGRIRCVSKEGVSGEIDLGERQGAIEKLPLHWYAGSELISYKGLPGRSEK